MDTSLVTHEQLSVVQAMISVLDEDSVRALLVTCQARLVVLTQTPIVT